MVRRSAQLAASLAAVVALQAPLCAIVCVLSSSASALHRDPGAERETPCHEEPTGSTDPGDCHGNCLDRHTAASTQPVLVAKPLTAGIEFASPAPHPAGRETLALRRAFPDPPIPDLLLLKSSLII